MAGLLMGALGAAGSHLLKAGGGYLLDKARPMLSRIGNYFGGLFGGNKGGNVGKTTMDDLYSNGINQTFDGIRDFAKGDWAQRKMPVLARGIENAGNALRERLQGYRPSMGPPQGGAEDAQMANGIEK